MTSRLLERDDLLAQLGAAWSAGGRLVFVGGEAGVGKTSLVRGFATRVDAPVLSGACDALATPTPLGPFVDLAPHVGGAFASGVDRGAPPRDVALALVAALGRPSLLVVEDVHWADEATLDVLRVLGRRADATSSLVLATYRDDEVDDAHPLRIVLGDLASAPAVSRVVVPPLTASAVRSLAEPHGADGDAIHRLTGGNAFYVTEVLAAGGAELPATVRDAVLARAARLDGDARRLLDVVALVPAGAELWLLEAVAGHELERLDACLDSGILREEGPAVVFRHELARRALEDAVAPRRRRTLHAALLRALATPPAGRPDRSRLAHHAEQAADAEAVLEHAPAAARRAAETGAHREAAAQYERGLRFADRLLPGERAALLAAFALEAQLTGRYVASLEARTEAIALYREVDDRRAAGQNLAYQTIPLVSLGRNAEAEDASRAAIEILEGLEPSRELAEAYGYQSYMRMLDRDNADGVAWGTKAVALAERLEEPAILSLGLNMIGTSHILAGDAERGIPSLLRSLEVAQRHGLELRIASAFSMLGTGLGEMYDLERAERYLREHIAFAAEHDTDSAYTRAWLALVHVYRGRWDDATVLAQEILGGPANELGRISALIVLGRVRARRGDPGVAEALDQALEISHPGGHLQRLGHVYAARAEAAWLEGARERTLVEARAGYGLALEKRHLWFAGELAYWQRVAGASEDAPEWIAEPYRLELAGDPRAAAAAWRSRGCPYEAARSLAATGEEAALLEALAEFERLGAGPAAKLARQALRAQGASVPRGPRRTTRANPAELTARELQVLRLLAVGMRNAEIAQELVLSGRTVDHHVSSILRKLGARTRGEAAAAAQRLGALEER